MNKQKQLCILKTCIVVFCYQAYEKMVQWTIFELKNCLQDTDGQLRKNQEKTENIIEIFGN